MGDVGGPGGCDEVVCCKEDEALTQKATLLYRTGLKGNSVSALFPRYGGQERPAWQPLSNRHEVTCPSSQDK